MARLRTVLREKNFFLLWVGQIISQFGDRLNQMALIAIIYSRAPGSAFELAKLLSFTIIPSFIISPIAGAFIDRWDRKATMIICDILRGLLVLTIPAFFLSLKSSFQIYTIVFLIFAVSCFFLPARLAIIPDLVSSDKLLAANSLFSVTAMIGAIAWFVIGGLLVEFCGVSGGLYLNSAIYFLSALAITFIVGKKGGTYVPSDSVKIREAIKSSLIEEIKEGLNYLKNHREVKFVFNVLFVLMAGAGAAYAVVIVFIQQAMGSVTRDLSLLGFFLGAGFFVGSLLYGKLGSGIAKPKTIFICLILSGISIFIFTALLKWTHSLKLASIMAMTLGGVVAPIGISTNTLLHEVSVEHMRGRVFSSLGIVMNFALLIFMLIASRLAEYIDRSWILYSVSIFYVISGILGFILKRKG